ncbi:MAG TPA: hypothetical protein VK589_21220, partial [Chryseolinea sp.]|nr:hypothetical protein [Chryseolinea sp.]
MKIISYMGYCMKNLALCFILCYVQYGLAQSANKSERNTISRPASKVFILPANASLKSVPWRDSIYRFPSFEDGRISLATGYSPNENVKFNYNLYFGQMDYIDGNGDTVEVKPIKELRMVKINEHSFLYDYNFGYIEVILQLP